jgi:hypothetical protein
MGKSKVGDQTVIHTRFGDVAVQERRIAGLSGKVWEEGVA